MKTLNNDHLNPRIRFLLQIDTPKFDSDILNRKNRWCGSQWTVDLRLWSLKFLHGALMREEYWQPSMSGHLVFNIYNEGSLPCEDCNENIWLFPTSNQRKPF